VEGGFEETRLHLSPPRLRSGRVPPRPVPPGAGGEWGGGPCADPLTRWGPCLRTPFLVATCVTPAPRGPRPCTRAPTPTPTTPLASPGMGRCLHCMGRVPPCWGGQRAPRRLRGLDGWHRGARGSAWGLLRRGGDGSVSRHHHAPHPQRASPLPAALPLGVTPARVCRETGGRGGGVHGGIRLPAGRGTSLT